MFKSKSIISLRVVAAAKLHTSSAGNTIKHSTFNINNTLNFHTSSLHQAQQQNFTNLLKECAGLNKKELDLFEQLRFDESDMLELQEQISETSYQAAMDRFNRIVNNKCVFIERDESIDLSKFSIKLIEFAASKVKTPIIRNSSATTNSISNQNSSTAVSTSQQEKQVKEEIIKQVVVEKEETPTASAATIPQQEETSATIEKVETPMEEEPSSISALAQEDSAKQLEEEDEVEGKEKSQFQLPTESYSTWDKETTLYVMKGIIRKGGAGMKAKQIQCLQRFDFDGRVLESVRIGLEKESKQVVSEQLTKQLAVPNHKPTPSIVSKIVEWVSNRK